MNKIMLVALAALVGCVAEIPEQDCSSNAECGEGSVCRFNVCTIPEGAQVQPVPDARVEADTAPEPYDGPLVDMESVDADLDQGVVDAIVPPDAIVQTDRGAQIDYTPEPDMAEPDMAEPDMAEPEPRVLDPEVYAEVIHEIIERSCGTGCHLGNPIPGDGIYRIGPGAVEAAVEASYADVLEFVNLEDPERSRLLLAATGDLHPGGAVWAAGSPGYEAVRQWIAGEPVVLPPLGDRMPDPRDVGVNAYPERADLNCFLPPDGRFNTVPAYRDHPSDGRPFIACMTPLPWLEAQEVCDSLDMVLADPSADRYAGNGNVVNIMHAYRDVEQEWWTGITWGMFPNRMANIERPQTWEWVRMWQAGHRTNYPNSQPSLIREFVAPPEGTQPWSGTALTYRGDALTWGFAGPDDVKPYLCTPAPPRDVEQFNSTIHARIVASCNNAGCHAYSAEREVAYDQVATDWYMLAARLDSDRLAPLFVPSEEGIGVLDAHRGVDPGTANWYAVYRWLVGWEHPVQ